MEVDQVSPNWFDRLVAFLFATIVVLGIATVAVAFAVYFPGTSGLDVPLP
jgi:hypothetical protein